jgi:hypothetical protein
MNVLDRLHEKARERAEDLTRLERLVLAYQGNGSERLQLAADLHNLNARANGGEVITCVDDLSALARLDVDKNYKEKQHA